jgi:hypothetical protein
MKHPQIEGDAAGPVTYEAFHVVWRHKGWEIEDEAVALEQAENKILGIETARAATPDAVDAITERADLEVFAQQVGVDPTEFYEFAPGPDGGKKTGKATGKVDEAGMRAAIKAKIAENNQ